MSFPWWHPRRRGRAVPWALAGVVALLAGCGGSDERPSPYAGAHAGLCAAALEVRTGSALDAQATFFNRADSDLHEFAADLAEKDRAVAGRLLTQKRAVEAGPWVDASPAQAERVLALARTTRRGIGALGQSEPKACPAP